MLFITSSVHVATRRTTTATLDDRRSPRAPGDKCPRCWRFVTETVPDGDLAGLCVRCADAVGGAVVAGR